MEPAGGVVDVHADSDDLVTEVVDVTGGSDDEDLVEVKQGAPPQYFHGYRRGRELGRGASGQVFVCNKKGTQGGGFAVKAVDLRRLHLQPNAEREEKKLSREVEILKRLPPHPAIVQLFDTFEEGDWFLLVLELVGGGDLYTVLTNREPPRLHEKEAAFVLAQLAEGLGFLHSQGIIHRDMKLENVLVAGERREKPFTLYTVKITDFGLSKAIGAGFSEARSTVGTRPYTAPEVLREDSHDFSSDLWCLGVLLFVLLAGHFPFSKIPTRQEELVAIVGKLKISETAKSVVLGLLQLEPRQRIDLATLNRHEWISEVESQDESEKPKRTRSVTPSPSLANVPEKEAIPSAKDKEDSAPGAAVPEPPALTASPASGPGIPPPPPPPPAELPPTAKRNIHMVQGEVAPASLQPEVMQVHMVVPDRLAGTVMKGVKHLSSTLGCQVRMISRKTVGDHRVVDHRIVIIGNYHQCMIIQELVYGRMVQAIRAEGLEPTLETSVTLFIRAEAAGVVIGKQGWVLGRVRKQSNARIQLLREEIRGQRPCIIEGTLQNILSAEKHVFDLVAAVPVQTDAGVGIPGRRFLSGPNLPRTRVSGEPFTGTVVSWKGAVGWIQPEQPLNHPKAFAHRQGQLYVHIKDVLGGEMLALGQQVRFHVYEDRPGEPDPIVPDSAQSSATPSETAPGAVVVGRSDLTANAAGSLWHCGGETESGVVLLDQCSVSGSPAPSTNSASPAVVVGAFARLALWDCFAPTMKSGTLAAVIRAEAHSSALVAGDGPTLGWPGWTPKSRRSRPEVPTGPSIGKGVVSWLDVSGNPLSPVKEPSASRPSSASQSLQNWPAAWPRGRTTSTVSAFSELDKPDEPKPVEKDTQVEVPVDVSAEEPAEVPELETTVETATEVSEVPEEVSAPAEGHDAWLRLRMEGKAATFGTEADRVTLFEILQMLAVKDAHKEERSWILSGWVARSSPRTLFTCGVTLAAGSPPKTAPRSCATPRSVRKRPPS
ncbi:unnamed protein product [Effrenium voratum]|nr:unnamed protein product [Effrenium voratum]